MCKYCNSDVLLSDFRGYSRHHDYKYGVVTYIEDGTLYIEAHPDSVDVGAYVEEEIEINFCPICGSKLKEDVNAQNGNA